MLNKSIKFFLKNRTPKFWTVVCASLDFFGFD